jgi:hypothetical protein
MLIVLAGTKAEFDKWCIVNGEEGYGPNRTVFFAHNIQSLGFYGQHFTTDKIRYVGTWENNPNYTRQFWLNFESMRFGNDPVPYYYKLDNSYE